VEYKADIRDIDAFKKACQDYKPEIIVHLAGLSIARPPENHAGVMLPINMQGTLNVIEVFESCASARRLIYTSSSMAYGHFTKQPQPEHSILDPVNAYGATKAAGEYFTKLSKKEWVIMRPTSVYGFTDCANRVTQLLIDAALAGKPAWVVKGEALDFSYVRDVAAGFALAITTPLAVYETFNISRGHARDASEFAELLKQYTSSFKYEIRNPNNTQVWRGSMDNAKAKKILGYQSRYGIEEGIKETLELMKEYS
jgi:UDP-glucose 4-epimerase